MSELTDREKELLAALKLARPWLNQSLGSGMAIDAVDAAISKCEPRPRKFLVEEGNDGQAFITPDGSTSVLLHSIIREFKPITQEQIEHARRKSNDHSSAQHHGWLRRFLEELGIEVED